MFKVITFNFLEEFNAINEDLFKDFSIKNIKTFNYLIVMTVYVSLFENVLIYYLHFNHFDFKYSEKFPFFLNY